MPRSSTSASEAIDAPHGRAWLYILAANGAEDLLKVGLTRDPLSRWSALHPRWYEAFDLSHSLLVACESRADAQALETRLHRDLVEHACPMPLTMRSAAGGFTEWYRGAYARARRFVAGCEAAGHVVVRDAALHLAPAMRESAERLESLLHLASRASLDGALGVAQRRALVDLVDGHRQFDPGLERRLPADAWREVRTGAMA